MMKNQKGFTLIELLVVIAIIGVLAGILFVAINPGTQISKADDAAIKAGMAGVPAQAVIVYDTAGYSYAGVCADASVAQAIGNAECADDAGAYAVEETLSDGSFYCVDSTGFRGTAAGTTRVTSAGTIYACDQL